MAKLIKFLFFLLILVLIGLIAYAYVGPVLGVNFAPSASEVRQDVVLEAE